MEDEQIKAIINQAMQQLVANDAWLLDNDLSERSITHKLAEYVQYLVEGYNVDCEYNGDIDRERNRKQIQLPRVELLQRELLRDNEVIADDDSVSRSVYPDIIIHRRGQNAPHNKCIIEVKKSTSALGDVYDVLKLTAYTSAEHGNNLQYQLGVFVLLNIGALEQPYGLRFFKNGHEI